MNEGDSPCELDLKRGEPIAPAPSRGPIRAIAHRAWRSFPEEVRNFAALALSSMANQVVRFFTGVVNANWLTPGLYGVNSIAGVVTRYISYGHLGVQNGANRRIPIERGRGQFGEAEAYASTAFWVVALVSAVVTLVAVSLYALPESSLVPKVYYPHIALLGVSTLFYQFFCSWLVSTNQSSILASMRARYDIPAVLLTTLGVLLFKLHGLLLVQSASMLVQAVVIARRTSFVPGGFSPSRALALVRQGAPILASSLMLYVFMTVDLLFVSTRYKSVEIGLYGFALSAAFFYRTYAQSMADVLQPKMGQVFGAENEDPRSLRRFTADYTEGLTPIFAMIAAVFLIGIPVAIELLLPDYRGSIAPFRALLLAELVLSLYIPGGHAMTLMRKQKQLIAWTMVGIGTAAFGFLFVLPKSASLVSVALLWLGVSVFVSLGIVFLANRSAHAGMPLPWRKLLHSFAVAGLALSALAFVGGWLVATTPVLMVLEACIRLLILEALLLALVLLIDPENPISGRVRAAFRTLKGAAL